MGANAEEELNDIINQLDKLQKEIETTEPKPSPKNATLKVVSSTAVPVEAEGEMDDFRGTTDASLDETLAALESEEPAKDSLLGQMNVGDEDVVEDEISEEPDFGAESAPQTEEDSVHHFDEVVKEETMSNKDGVPASVTMTLEGNMTLKLRYEFEGQEVNVGFEDECLKVQLTDGTEFKIPVTRKGKTLKSVA